MRDGASTVANMTLNHFAIEILRRLWCACGGGNYRAKVENLIFFTIFGEYLST
jgi:hypothetical protein